MTRCIHLDPVGRVPASFPRLVLEPGRDQDPLLEGEPSPWFAHISRQVVGLPLDHVPDVVSRLCGACSPMHQLAACVALETALEMRVPPAMQALRRLLALGDAIRNHAHHLFLLQAPDLLGFRDAWEMGRPFGGVVAMGLRLREVGARLVALVGGRVVHPVNLRVGGLHALPLREQVDQARPDVEAARQVCLEALEWLREMPFPSLERTESHWTVEDTGYPLGAVRSLPLPAAPGRPGGAVGGPLARFNLHHARLGPMAREAAARVGLAAPCGNPFLRPLVAGVEILQALEDCCEVLEQMEWPREAAVPLRAARAGEGTAQVETSRGPLSHSYRLSGEGLVEAVQIDAPSRGVLRLIEADLAALRPAMAGMPAHRAAWVAGQAVRNHDPCPACSRD